MHTAEFTHRRQVVDADADWVYPTEIVDRSDEGDLSDLRSEKMNPREVSIHKEIAGQMSQIIDEMFAQIGAALDAQGVPLETRNEIFFWTRLALTELFANAVIHGHEHDPRKPITVEWDLESTSEGLVFKARITDQGEGFVPEDVPDPLAAENLEKPTGRGNKLVERAVDRVHWEGTTVTIEKKLPIATESVTAA